MELSADLDTGAQEHADPQLPIAPPTSLPGDRGGSPPRRALHAW
jgi:hypothetical protein